MYTVGMWMGRSHGNQHSYRFTGLGRLWPSHHRQLDADQFARQPHPDPDPKRRLTGKLNALSADYRQKARILYRIAHGKPMTTRQFEVLATHLLDIIRHDDPALAEHVQRVAQYAQLIAQQMGIPKSQLPALHYGALFHDIGKLGVPVEILQKEGRYDADEIYQTHQHVAHTYLMLNLIRFKQPHFSLVPHIAGHHHENWDGSGYLVGLQAEEIPLLSRIIRAADVFDSVTSRRAYRTRMPLTQALELLEDEKGYTFDPRVVDSFFQLRLSDVAHLLCQHSGLGAEPKVVRETLATIPQDLSLRDYLALLDKKQRSAGEDALIANFTRLYEWLPISSEDYKKIDRILA